MTHKNFRSVPSRINELLLSTGRGQSTKVLTYNELSMPLAVFRGAGHLVPCLVRRIIPSPGSHRREGERVMGSSIELPKRRN